MINDLEQDGRLNEKGWNEVKCVGVLVKRDGTGGGTGWRTGWNRVERG